MGCKHENIMKKKKPLLDITTLASDKYSKLHCFCCYGPKSASFQVYHPWPPIIQQELLLYSTPQNYNEYECLTSGHC